MPLVEDDNHFVIVQENRDDVSPSIASFQTRHPMVWLHRFGRNFLERHGIVLLKCQDIFNLLSETTGDQIP